MTSILNVAGPLDVFAKTAYCISQINPTIKEQYTTHIVSIDSTTVVQTSSGLPVVCE